MSAKVIKLETRRARWASAINKSWSMALQAANNAVKAGVATGDFLIQAKADLPHGEFGDMVENDLQFSRKKAYDLMKIASCPRISNDARAKHLPEGWSILSELASLSNEDFKWAKEQGLITKDMSRDSVRAIRKVRTTDDEVVRLSGRQPPRGPTPKEARELARASGRMIVANDGRMYTGTTEDEDADYGRKLATVYGIKEACTLISTCEQTPQEWLAQAEDHWIFEFNPKDIDNAVGWLTELRPLLARRLKEVRRA